MAHRVSKPRPMDVVEVDADFSHVEARQSFCTEQQLAQESEVTVEVRLPRGPAAFCSPRMQGKRPKEVFNSKRTYQVTIEHGAHTKLVRRARKTIKSREEQALPATSSARRSTMQQLPKEDEEYEGYEDEDSGQEGREDMVSDSDSDMEPLPTKLMAASMNKKEEYYEKCSFRQQRAPAFGKAKLFPVLVNRRLVPEWRETGHLYDDNANHLSPRQRTRQRLVAPTLACAVRQQVRKPLAQPGLPWHPHSNAETVKHENARGPALCHDNYNQQPPGGMRFRDSDSEEAKRRWLDENTFACASLTEAKNAIVRGNGGLGVLEVEKATQEARLRGAKNKESLQCRYEMRLEAFKDEQDKRGPISNFAKRELQFKKDAGRIVVAPVVQQEEQGFAGFAMGFARFKTKDQPAITDDPSPPDQSPSHASSPRRTIVG